MDLKKKIYYTFFNKIYLFQELQYAINEIKDGKSLGLDEIINEMIKIYQ